MKKLNISLAGLAFVFIVFTGCKKDGINELSGSSIAESVDGDGALQKKGGSGAVYIMDNAVGGNNILVYARSSSGQLTSDGAYSTGGNGSGGGLGSQGSLIIEKDYLYACNAGSNEISVLRMTNSGLTFIDKISSNGVRPISVTVDKDILYVLNAGGSGNISGFNILPNHHLSPIAGSTQPLSSMASGPAQVEFDHSGKQLVVTEKATNNIVIYDVNNSGVASMGVVHPSVGATPFGFAFGKSNTLIVSDAFGGNAGQSALTSYSLSNSGNLSLITGPVATTQTAACWVVVTNDGHYCYTTNTGSDNVSGYSIQNSGALTLLNPNGITGVTGDAPIDMSLSKNSRFLYTLNAMGHTITMFEVGQNGSLTSLGELGGVPTGAVGMAAE